MKECLQRHFQQQMKEGVVKPIDLSMSIVKPQGALWLINMTKQSYLWTKVGGIPTLCS